MTRTRTRSVRRTVVVLAVSAVAVLAAVTPVDAAPGPATVVGTVTGPNGEVLAGIPVGLAAVDSAVTALHTVTDAQGRYRITGIPADTQAAASVVPPPHYTGGTAPYGYLRGISTYQRLPHGSTTTLDVHLGLGAAMAGRVLDDRTGGPVAGTAVKLFWNAGGDSQYGAVVTTAADGSWWAHNLDQRGSRVWTPIVDGSGQSADARFGWEYTVGPNAPYTIPAGGVAKGIVFRVRPLAKIVLRILPAGTSVRASAGGLGDGGDYRLGVGPFTLHPVARYGAGGTTGPVCAEPQSATSPGALGEQCQDVPFSATAQQKVTLTVAAG